MYKYGRAKCKCHGVSGSCNVRTCWHQLPTFADVGDRLRERYDGASLVKFNRQGTALVAEHRRFKRPTGDDLVFFEASPDYCEVLPYSCDNSYSERKCVDTIGTVIRGS